MTDQDLENDQPSRRRRPRQTLERPGHEQASVTEASRAESDSPTSSTDVEFKPELVQPKTKSRKIPEQKERVVVTSDQISQSGNDEEIDVTELARLKRSVQTRFFVFFIIGLATIFFTSMLNKFLAIGAPIAVMSFYVLSTYKLTRLRTAKTLFADSVYYMGFLFTFVTLMFAIAPAVTDITVIINQMGVALSTTIFGMLVRVLMSHFDGIEMNVDEDVFAKLSETANKIESITDSLVNSSKEQVHQINATTAQALETTRRVQQTLDEITSDKFLSADRIRDLQTRMTAIADSLGDFDARIQDTNQGLIPMLDIMREASKISREFSDFRLKISHLDDLIDQMNSHISSAGQTAGSATDLVADLAVQIQLAKEEISTHMENAREIEAHVEHRLVEIMKIVRAG